VNLKHFNKLFSKQGIGLAEVMVAGAIASGLIVALMKVSKNSNDVIKRDYANQSRTQLYNQINRNLGNTAGCMNTLGPVVTASNASGNVTVPSIKDKNNAVIYQVGSKLGDLTVKSLVFSGYTAASGMGKLTIRSTYKKDASAYEVKPTVLNISASFNPTTGAMTSCSSSGSENFWLAMTSPDLGIYFNGGSVLIGTGTISTGSNDVAFGVGEDNLVASIGGFASGQQNQIDGASPYSFVLGGKNTITTGVYSSALGYQNAINISTGSVGSAGPLASTAIGYSNNVTGSEAMALGVGNSVIDRFGVAMGVNNVVGAISGTAIGVSNVVSAANGVAIGTFAEANGLRSSAIGSYVKSNGGGTMTIGDNSVTGYTLNSIANSFKARFDGGYTFHSSTSQTELNSLYFNDGYLGVGEAIANANSIAKSGVSNAKVSLEVTGGISRLAQENWINASISSGAVSWYTRPGYESTQYYKDSTGRVSLKGFLTATSASVCTSSTTGFTLPAGYRPATDLHFYQPGVDPLASMEVKLYQVTIYANGNVTFMGYCGMGTAWIQFTGINFRAEN
jgi:hypothetical protein